MSNKNTVKDKKNSHGGGARTNENGLAFEKAVNPLQIFEKYNMTYTEQDGKVYYGDLLTGYYLCQYDIYPKFFDKFIKDYDEITPIKHRPDGMYVNLLNQTIYIFENKSQEGKGSVDSKILTGWYYKKIYEKYATRIGFRVEFTFILCDWFKQHKYSEYRNAIHDQKCNYTYSLRPTHLGLGELLGYNPADEPEE